jgi:TonB-linked SusC/RagA family outer membrane protein
MKKNLLAFLLLSMVTLSSVFAQGRKITGKVTGADDGQPIPGVTVAVKGTTRGLLTDMDGKFAVEAKDGDVLKFSFIGYSPVEITVTAGGNYEVKLKDDTRLLTEVVVKDSYGAQSKKSYTGAASTVSGRDNENKPFATPLQALQGEVAGLNISTNSGQPGANVQVRLRGIGSLGAGSNPLYVIDGMIIPTLDNSRLGTANGTNVLAGINANDIESITVLKDAAATAIYGSRGSNGVIVINTKKGKAGKTQVRFDAEFGTTKNLDLPDAGKPLTGDQYKTLLLEGLTNAGVTSAGLTPYINSYGLNGPSNNWYNLVTKRGTQQQYNVSVNGGNQDTKIFTSAGYFKQDATTIGSSLTRVTGLLNVEHNISRRISLSTGLNFSNVLQNIPANGGGFVSPVLSSYFLRPFQLARNADGSLNTSNSGNTNFPNIYNPLYMVSANGDKRTASQTRGLGNTQLRWNILDDLKFTSFGSIDYNVLEENVFNNPIMGDGRTSGGRGYNDYTRTFNWVLRNQLDYRYNIKAISDFYVDATVGYEAQRSNQFYISANSNGYPATQPLLTASANAATPILGNSSFSNNTFDSYYARATANYKNRFSLSGSFRRDGSSVFGTAHQFGSFYSIGGAWNIDQENFFKAQNIFSSAKFRSSYGTNGNAAGLTNYGWRPLAGYGINYAGGNGQNYNTVGNSDLAWEGAQKFDIGADFGFFNDRLVFDVDYYHNNINKLIQAAPVSLTTGFASVVENVGSMLNKGFEFSVKGYPIKSDNFNWSTSFNISLNQNTVKTLLNHASYINGQFQVKEGLDFYTYYTRLYAGVDPANGNALWFTDGKKTATTTNYSAAARVNIGQADPKYFGGFNNTFNYKGITLSADVYYNFGNMINDGWANYLNDGTSYTFNKYQYSYEHRWTTVGQVTDVPKYVAGGINGGQSSSYSSRFLYYGDYIRLKNVTIGYDLKNIAFLKSIGVSKLYLYGRGTNLWTKTYDKRLPFDPEVGITGVSNLEVPQVKTFTIGLNVGL